MDLYVAHDSTAVAAAGELGGGCCGLNECRGITGTCSVFGTGFIAITGSKEECADDSRGRSVAMGGRARRTPTVRRGTTESVGPAGTSVSLFKYYVK